MQTTRQQTELINHLYDRADHMLTAWPHAPLADDFGGRMVDAVLAYMQRHPQRVPTDPEHCRRYAACCLRSFWNRTAARDVARANEAVRSGRRPEICSLSLPAVASRVAAKPDDYPSMQITPGAVVRQLMSVGFSKPQAFAFVWRVMHGLEWAEVAALLRDNLGYHASEQQLRKWGQRRFARVLPYLKSVYWGGGDE